MTWDDISTITRLCEILDRDPADVRAMLDSAAVSGLPVEGHPFAVEAQ